MIGDDFTTFGKNILKLTQFNHTSEVPSSSQHPSPCQIKEKTAPLEQQPWHNNLHLPLN